MPVPLVSPHSQDQLPVGARPCSCSKAKHTPKLAVLTGGPGGGKTAILELARKYFCRHVVFLPEAAGVVFSGGFPRIQSTEGLRSAQRTIFRVQREMEHLAVSCQDSALILCDRGVLDGLAYWPGSRRQFLSQVGTTLEEQIHRYSLVIHIETAPSSAYTNNGIRLETAEQAQAIDRRIREVWKSHPHLHTVNSSTDFLDKAAYALNLIRSHIPACCRGESVVINTSHQQKHHQLK